MKSGSSSSNQIVIKLILCGDFGVGKSSLFRRFVHDSFVESNDRTSTLGFDHFEKTFVIDGKNIVLQLWDTGGLERVASVTTSYYKHADAALLVFAWDAFESFNSLSNHLLEVLTSAENAKLFVCGNKTDLRRQGMGPSQDDVDAFYRENQINETENLFKAQTYRTSCKSGDNVHAMFRDIARHMAYAMAPPRPNVDYFQLRQDSLPGKVQSSCCSSGVTDATVPSSD